MNTIRMAAWALFACTTTAAMAEGPLSYPDPEDRPAAASTSALTRAEVMAEFRRARDEGELALNEEDSGSFWLALLGWRTVGATRMAQVRVLAARD